MSNFISTRTQVWLNFIIDFSLFLYACIYYWVDAIYRFFAPLAKKSLKDEVILITGAANGIGRQICLQLVNHGATLICWDIQKIKNEELVRELRSLGINAFGYEVDISDPVRITEAAAMVRKEVGDVTIVINNAGIMPCNNFLEMDPKLYELTYKINVLSHMWINREFLPKMVQNNHGHIVALASICGFAPGPKLAAYTSSKSAVIMYMETMRQELRCLPQNTKNVNFSTVYPIAVRTAMTTTRLITGRPGIYMPLLDPSYVAEKILDGMRRNCENIYIPRIVILADFLNRWAPSKVITAVLKFSNLGMHPAQESTPNLTS